MEKRNEVPYTPVYSDCCVLPIVDPVCGENLNDFTDPLDQCQSIPQRDESIESNSLPYLEKLKTIKPQLSSVIGGYIQLSISGFQYVLGFWWIEYVLFFKNLGRFTCIMLSFNVTAILGGVLAGYVNNVLRKQTIYYLTGSIMVISSLILLIGSTDEVGVLYSRALAGFGHGLVYNVVVIHAGENSMKTTRGIVTSTINCIVWLSIFIGSLIIATVKTDSSNRLYIHRIFGLASLVVSVFAIICTKCWTQESVVYFLNRGMLKEAFELSKHLQNEKSDTNSISDDFEEMQRMVYSDKQENKNIFSNNNKQPLKLVVALKLLHASTNSSLVHWVMIWFIFDIIHDDNALMDAVLLSGLRLIGSILQTLLADSIGRRYFLIISCTLSGICLLIMKIVPIISGPLPGLFVVFLPVTIVLQLSMAIGIDPMHHVILSEAFSTSKKTWSVVFITAFENAAKILFTVLFFVSKLFSPMYIIASVLIPAIYSLILAIILYYSLPETRGLSLSKVRVLFRSIKWSLRRKW